jgi:hypothetical protein
MTFCRLLPYSIQTKCFYEMKNNEIIQITALLAVAAAFLYRKFGKKNKTGTGAGKLLSGKSRLSSNTQEDEYEPYSGNKSKDIK